MRRAPPSPLPRLIEAFFREHLQCIRAASPHTVRAYRDALRLYFVFLADRRGVGVDRLRPRDLDVEGVLEFLHYLESERGNAVATRNARLAAIRGLFAFLLRHDPSRAEQYHRVLAIPTKRSHVPTATYLEPSVVRHLIALPDVSTQGGARDHALLLFLYNTGARVSEALGLEITDLDLSPPRQARLHGKGDRDRLCPLWKETAIALRRVLDHPAHPHAGSVVRNAHGAPLSRDGVAYVIGKYARTARKTIPELRRVRVTPHVLRHSCAVALLQAGIDVVVIRDYLGHVSVATTSRYLAANLETKRDALEAFWERAGLEPRASPHWKPTSDLLRFLESL